MYRTSHRILLVLTPIMVVLTASLASGDLHWEVTVVEDGYRVGEWMSLTVFPEGHPLYPGQPAVSYQDYADGDLEFAWNDGIEWRQTTVDAEGNVGRYTSIAMFPMDYPDAALAGQPAISYNDETNGDLKFAWLNAGDPLVPEDDAWHIIVVDGADGRWVGRYTSLVILPMDHPEETLCGQPVISYGDYSTEDLMIAWRTSDEAWHTAVIDETGSLGWYTSLAMLPLDHTEPNLPGNLTIAHFDNTNHDLKFTWHSSGFDLATGWQSVTVPVPGNDVGRWASLAIFPMDHPIPEWRGQPAISYRDETNDDLEYAHHEGDYDFSQGWQSCEVDVEGNVGSYTSLAILPINRGTRQSFDGTRGDLSGMPVISYLRGDDLAFAWLDGIEWQTATLDWYGFIGYYSTLAILPSGDPAIAYRYHYGDAGEVRCASFHGFGWQIDALDRSRKVGEYSSLAVFPANHPSAPGQPAITYYVGWPDYDLKYAERDPDDPAVWHLETVDVSGGSWTSLAIFPLDHPDAELVGQPAVSYAGGGLKYYQRKATTGWCATSVDAGSNSALALLPSGRPAIGYQGNADLRYAECVSGDCCQSADWTKIVVDSAWDVGEYSSLSMLPSGKPAISYRDSTNGDLRYVECVGSDCLDPNEWAAPIILDEDDIGGHTSLVALPTGHPAISYYDLGQGDLRFAWRDDDGWYTTAVDSDGNLGAYTSLIILPSGQPGISYNDTSEPGLKFSWHEGEDFCSGWRTSTVDASAGNSPYTSLALLPSGQPAISYFDYPHWDLRLAVAYNTYDLDEDGDVDWDDYAGFADCMAGPGQTPYPDYPTSPQQCLDAFDGDFDADVDLADFAEFSVMFTGTGP